MFIFCVFSQVFQAVLLQLGPQPFKGKNTELPPALVEEAVSHMMSACAAYTNREQARHMWTTLLVRFFLNFFNSIVPVGFIVPVVTLLSQLALYCPSWHFIVPAGTLLSQWVLYCPIWHSLVPIGALLSQLALCSPSRLYRPSSPSIVPVGTLLSQLALYCSGWHSVVPVGNFHRGKSGPFQRRAIC